MVSDVFDKSGDREFLHIKTTRYADGQQMLSVTGVVCERSRQVSVGRKLVRSLGAIDRHWSSAEKIELPFLSIKEQLVVNTHLPHHNADEVGAELHKILGYCILSGEQKSIQALSQYAHYRAEYPTLIRLEI